MEADSSIVLEELSVSTNKIGFNLSQQPVAGTTIRQSQIDNLNIVNLKQFSDLAPNFYMPDYGSRVTSSIYVRGLGSRIDLPTIALNYDNIPILNKNNFDFDTQNVERAEIIRGAQSTLYGRNSMVGLVNIYTVSPFNFQGTKILASYGSYNQWQASVGHYNLTENNLAYGAAVDLGGNSGYYKNEYNGSRTGADKYGILKSRLAWEAPKDWVIDNSLTLTLSRQTGYPYESLENGSIAYNDTCFYQRFGILEGLTVTGLLTSKIKLSSVTSYQYLNDNLTLDQDFLPYDYFTLSQKINENGLTQEINLKNAIASDYNWLSGVFVWGRFGTMHAPVLFKDYGITNLIEHYRNEANPDYPIVWDDRQFLIDTRFKPSSWGAAIYHESKYTLDRWTFSAGLRIEYEKVALGYQSDINTSYTIYNNATGEVYRNTQLNINDAGHLSKSYLEFLPKMTVMYRFGSAPSNGNIYLNIARGFKSGGYNSQMFSDVMQQRLRKALGLSMQYDVEDIVGYEPEKAWNYELGFHALTASGKLQLSGAVFYIDCRDQQLTMFPSGTTTGRIMANAGKSRSVGLEASAIWEVNSKWNISGAFGLADARFVSFNDGINSYDGYHIPYAPLTTSFVEVDYQTPSPISFFDTIGFTASAKGTGPIWWNEQNDIRQNFYLLCDATLRVTRSKMQAEIWFRNITSTNYSVFYFQSIGNSFLQRGKPFSFGLTLRLTL